LRAPYRHIKSITAFSLAVAILAFSCGQVLATPAPVQDSLMSQQQQAQALEQDIASLEQKLAHVKQDSFSVSGRLAEVEKNILDCSMEIDAAQAEVDAARNRLNNSIRAMYIKGRIQTLVQLLSSTDVSEFLAWYDNMITVASNQAATFKALKDKRKRLRVLQEKLNAFKQEQASLNTSADTRPVEAALEQKKSELAGVASTLITMELPATDAPPPSSFSPSSVFARPDVNAFASTGQMFSGYSSWYSAGNRGKPTASGEVFDEDAFTCAHRTLPFGTWLKVSFRSRSVIVKVNDRGPAAKDRVIDLSRGAAEAIGLTGVQLVDCEIVVPAP